MEFGQILWSLLIIFFMVMYFMILFSVIIDIFRRHDMGGGMKAVWIILLLFIPPVIDHLRHHLRSGHGATSGSGR